MSLTDLGSMGILEQLTFSLSVIIWPILLCKIWSQNSTQLGLTSTFLRDNLEGNCNISPICQLTPDFVNKLYKNTATPTIYIFSMAAFVLQPQN